METTVAETAGQMAEGIAHAPFVFLFTVLDRKSVV
jgi:hypothetical protein